MKNLNILKLLIFIFACQFSMAQNTQKVSSAITAVKAKRLNDIPIAKEENGKIILAVKKEILQKAVQSAVSDLKQNFHVDDVKIAASNIKTYYLAIVGTDKSKKITTIFLPLGAADQSPNYFFIPSTGHVVTCINITGCPNNCSIVKYGYQKQLTGCNCGGFDFGDAPANGNTPTESCNFKINKLIYEKDFCMAVKMKLTALVYE